MPRPWAAALALLLAQAAWSAPCAKATPDCSEWIAMADRAMRGLVYRSYALEVRNPAMTRALVIVHGGSRDAHDNFRHALGAAFLAGALEDTLIVSPRFASNAELSAAQVTGGDAVAAARSPARDALAPGELNWISQFGARHWNAGGIAANGNVTSYEVIDGLALSSPPREACCD